MSFIAPEGGKKPLSSHFVVNTVQDYLVETLPKRDMFLSDLGSLESKDFLLTQKYVSGFETKGKNTEIVCIWFNNKSFFY